MKTKDGKPDNPLEFLWNAFLVVMFFAFIGGYEWFYPRMGWGGVALMMGLVLLALIGLVILLSYWGYKINQRHEPELFKDWFPAEPEPKPEPEPKKKSTHVELILDIKDPSTNQTFSQQFNIDLYRLILFAKGTRTGRPFSEREWTGYGRLLTRKEFKDIRKAWLKTGFLRWKNENAHGQGVELTRKGNALVNGLAELNHYNYVHVHTQATGDAPLVHAKNGVGG